MKKTLIIALLVALVLGVFTACNGDVNAALMGKRTITLEIDNTYSANWTFADGKKTMELPISSDWTKWEDALDKCEITVKNDNDSIEATKLTLTVLSSDYAHFVGDDIWGHFVFSHKSFAPTVELSDTIEVGGTYTIILDSVS